VMEVDVETGTERMVRRIHLRGHNWSPDGRRLAFIRRSELMVLELDSGRMRRVFRGAIGWRRAPSGHVAVPSAWSPDAQKLVVEGSIRGRRGLVLVDARRRQRPRLLVAARTPSWIWGWSPDGRTIAYGFTIRKENPEEADGREGLAVVDAVGTSRPQLVTAAGTMYSAEWSPDGSTFVYSVSSGKYSCCMVFLVDRDGSNEHLLAGPAGQALEPAWSPDGHLIAYSTWCCGEVPGLHVIAPDGTHHQRLTSTVGWSRWSPDGSLLAFRFPNGVPAPAQTIVIAHADGSGVRTIATNTFAPTWPSSEPVWSPNSRQLAYVGADATGVHLYLVEANGTGTRQLTYAPGYDTWPQWVTGEATPHH
jgi:Tol biopolymer transport system component